MSQYVDTFAAHATGVGVPTGWSLYGDTGPETIEIAADAGAFNGKVLRVNRGDLSGEGPWALGLDAAGSHSSFEVLAKVKRGIYDTAADNYGQGTPGPGGRIDGLPDVGLFAFVARMEPVNYFDPASGFDWFHGADAIPDVINGLPGYTETEPDWGYDLGEALGDVWLLIRCRVEDDTFYGRVWLYGEEEPATWQLDGLALPVWAAALPAGPLGLIFPAVYGANADVINDVDWVGIGTSGDPAPNPELTATTKIVLEDPGGGAGPGVFSDQFVGNGATYPSTDQRHIPDHYLRAPDGTLCRVLQTRVLSATQTAFWVEDHVVSHFAEGDLVSIHPDDQGTLLHRLYSPRIVDFGRVARVKELDVLGRGQYALNPLLEDWADKGDSWGFQVDGDHTGNPTSLNVKNVQGTKTFPQGAAILFTAQSISPPAITPIHVVRFVAAPGAVITGSGSVPLTGALPSSPLITDDAPALCCVQGLPDGWEDPGGSHFAFYRPTSVTTPLSGLTALDDSTDPEASYGGLLRMDGGDPGVDKIYAGDRITIGSRERSAMHDALADGSGNFQVVLNQPATWSATDPVTVTRPQFLAWNAGAVLMLPNWGSQQFVQSPLSPVHFLEATPKLWHSFFGTVWNPTDAAIEVATVPGKKKPKTALWDGSSEVDSLEYSEDDSDFGAFTVGAGSEYDFIVRSAYEMSETDSFAVRPYGGWITQTSSLGGGQIDQRGWLWTMGRAIEISIANTIGKNEIVPVVGFPPNLLHQDGNRELVLKDGWVPELRTSAVQLLESGMSPETVKALIEGQPARVLVPELGVDAVYVLDELEINPEDPADVQYVLGLRYDTLTEQLARATTSTPAAIASAVAAASAGSASTVDAYSKSESDTLLADAAALDAAARASLVKRVRAMQALEA